MKKMTFVALILVSAMGSLASAEEVALEHPLAQTVLNLTKVSEQLKLEKSSTSQPDLRLEVDEISRQVSSLTSRALLAPLKISDQAISQYGYDIAFSDRVTYAKQLEVNPRYQSLKASAFALEPQRWLELRTLVDNNSKIANAVVSLENNGAVSNALAESDKNEVLGVSSGRWGLWARALSGIDNTITCIDVMGKAYLQSGLRPVRVDASQYKFSEEDLQRVYGVSDLSQVPSTRKNDLLTQLKGLRAQAKKYRDQCISNESVLFVDTQFQKMQSN